MANKLDVYQVVLGKKARNFKEFICKKCNIAETSTNQVVFNAFYRMLINQLSPAVYQITEKKIGFTILEHYNAISADAQGDIVPVHCAYGILHFAIAACNCSHRTWTGF